MKRALCLLVLLGGCSAPATGKDSGVEADGAASDGAATDGGLDGASLDDASLDGAALDDAELDAALDEGTPIDGAVVDVAAPELDAGAGATGEVSIVVADFSSGNPAQYSLVSAAFYNSGPTQTGNATCDTKTFGACVVTSCTGQVFMHYPMQVSAGTITLAGGTPSAQQALSFAQGMYAAIDQSSLIWMPGTALTITAAGDAVPAFTAHATLPARFTISAPSFPATAGAPIAIDRSKDLTLTSDAAAGAPGDLQVGLSATGATDVNVICTYPHGGAGAAIVVPTAALSLLPSGMGYYGANGQSTQSVGAGAYSVDVDVVVPAVGGDGTQYFGAAQFN